MALELPKPFAPKDRRFQQDTLRLLRKVPPHRPSVSPDTPPPVLVDHPVGACPDAEHHVKWERRAARTRQRVSQLHSELRRTGAGLVEDFNSICRLLENYGYLNGWALTVRGERLRFIYNELDLLMAETLERGLMGDLSIEELAALASCFVFEPRTEERTLPVWPTAKLFHRWEALDALWGQLVETERSFRLPSTRRPDPGFVVLAYEWAIGADLDDLAGGGLAPGDFVRVSRQLVDLIRQIRDVSPELASQARSVLEAIDRGVVAAMGVG
jgi:ATP-dependent RNA helicase HelY